MSNKHIHHDLIVKWAADTTQVVEFKRKDNLWEKTGTTQWFPNNEYRIRHKHQDLIDRKKERPELVVEVNIGDKWFSVQYPNWDEIYEYRLVEPVTKKKVKMWQWVVSTPYGPSLSLGFHPDEATAYRDGCYTKIIQRADWTEIEVSV